MRNLKLFFLFLNQNIHRGYSFEYAEHLLKLIGTKKDNFTLKKSCLTGPMYGHPDSHSYQELFFFFF